MKLLKPYLRLKINYYPVLAFNNKMIEQLIDFDLYNVVIDAMTSKISTPLMLLINSQYFSLDRLHSSMKNHD